MRKILTRRILLVAKDQVELELLRRSIKRQMKDYDIIAVTNVREAFMIARDMNISAVLSDVGMCDDSGLDLLKHIKRFRASIPVLLMASYADIEAVVEAIKLGAEDVIERPVCDNINVAVRAIRSAIANPDHMRARV
jgi:two-component system response regulator HydG